MRLQRNLLGGCAGARCHRPPSGNGLNERAQAAIRAVRLLEEHVKLWEVEPHMELLSERAGNAAYIAAKPGRRYAVYFPYGGRVQLDLSACEGPMTLRWISVTTGEPVRDPQPIGPGVVELAPIASGGWLAAIIRD